MSLRSADSYEDISLPEITTEVWSQICANPPTPPSTTKSEVLSPVKAVRVVSDRHLYVEESDSSLWDEFPHIQAEDWVEVASEIRPDTAPSTESGVPCPPLYLILDKLFEEPVIADIEDEGMPKDVWHVAANLITKYKRNGALSVTNLVQPLWCEYKMYYNLVGLEKAGVERRLKEFEVSRKVIVDNKVVETKVTIKVDQAAIHIGEKNKVRGLEIHEKLEKEVVPVRRAFRTKTPEEDWGLKLLNMITGLAVLKKNGLWRELSVFGFIRNIPVNGIIDKLVLEPRPGSDRGNILRISDDKTRSARARISRSVPKEHKVQLMIYKQLLDGLLSPSFDWECLFRTYRLDSSRIFSDGFIAQTIDLAQSNELGKQAEDVMNLDDLRIVWEKGVLDLDLADGVVEPELSVVYRQALPTMQGTSRAGGSSGSGESMILAQPTFEYDEEFAEQAVFESLEFWLGTRRQRGVDLEEIWKCEVCEYKTDCEWRAEQASAFSQKMASKR